MASRDGLSSALERTLGRERLRRARGRLMGRQHLLPDFIIIGAARSGTTYLLGQLNAHPNVLEGPRETHFFDTHRYTYGLDWYRLRFPAERTRREAHAQGLHPVVTGESSPSYLSHPNAPARLARAIPDAKLLVLLRDPSARAASHWSWCLRQCGETRSFRDAVDAEIGPPGDPLGLRIPRDKRPSDPLVVRRGIYQPQLERWQTHFPREQVMIIQSERWFRDPVGVMTAVCDFLGLPRLERLPRVMRNRNKPHEPYDPEVLARLREFYRPYNEELADYLDMDLDWDRSGDS